MTVIKATLNTRASRKFMSVSSIDSPTGRDIIVRTRLFFVAKKGKKIKNKAQ